MSPRLTPPTPQEVADRLVAGMARLLALAPWNRRAAF